MQYYKVDTRNLSFTELWRIAPGLGFGIAALLKLLRVPLPVRTAVPLSERLIPLDASVLDEDGRRQRVRPYLEPCEQAGLELRFFFKEATIDPDSSAVGVALLSADGSVYGFIGDAVSRVGARTTRVVGVSLTSLISADRVLVTSSSKMGLQAPPGVEEEIYTSYSTTNLLRRHGERLAELLAEFGEKPLLIRPEKLEEIVLGLSRRAVQFHVDRGAYVAMTEKEVEKLRLAKPWSGGSRLKSVAVWALVFLGVFWWNSFRYDFEEPELERWWLEGAVSTYSCDEKLVAPEGLLVERDSWKASFADVATARGTLESLLAEVPGSGAAYVLGTDLFWKDGDRSVWVEKIEAHDVTPVQLDEDTQPMARLTWLGDSPQAARETLEYLDGYFLAPPHFVLQPPWQQPLVGPSDAAEQMQIFRTRRTFGALARLPVAESFLDRILAPFDFILWMVRPSLAEKRLTGSFERSARLRAEKGRELLAERSELDAEIGELYFAWLDENTTAMFEENGSLELSEVGSQLAVRMGRLGEDQTKTGPAGEFADTPFSISGSRVELDEGNRLVLPWLFFDDALIAVPAVLEWICLQGGLGTIEIDLDAQFY